MQELILQQDNRAGDELAIPAKPSLFGADGLPGGSNTGLAAEGLAGMSALGIRPLDQGKHRLAVLVPFRDVEKELMQFVPHMHEYFKRQGVEFSIIIINQTDNFR